MTTSLNTWKKATLNRRSKKINKKRLIPGHVVFVCVYMCFTHLLQKYYDITRMKHTIKGERKKEREKERKIERMTHESLCVFI